MFLHCFLVFLGLKWPYFGVFWVILKLTAIDNEVVMFWYFQSVSPVSFQKMRQQA